MRNGFVKACAAAIILCGAAGFAMPASAAGVKVGVLTCNVASGWGFIFGSTKELHCTYAPNKGTPERYSGTVDKYGVDIGYTKAGVLVWAVVAPTSSLKPGALEGHYVGGTASATVGVGAGANALIGGFDQSVALQPVSIEGNTGLNVAAGIGAITLKHDKM
jgi:hypothetical protein